MKKGWKIFWILIACIGSLGIVITIISFILGFSYNNAFHYIPELNHKFLLEDSEDIVHITDDEDFSLISDSSSEEAYDQINSLKLNIDYGEINLLPSNDDQVHIASRKHRHSDYLDINQDGNELSISSKGFDKHFSRDHKHSEIYIYIPAKPILKEITINMSAGELDVEHLEIENVDIKLNTGSCSFEQFNVQNISAKINAGELEFKGDVTKNLAIDCSAGEVDVTLDGSKEDYNYSLTCDAGSIDIDEDRFSGLSSEKTYDNHSSKNILLNCSLGEIELNFLQ